MTVQESALELADKFAVALGIELDDFDKEVIAGRLLRDIQDDAVDAFNTTVAFDRVVRNDFRAKRDELGEGDPSAGETEITSLINEVVDDNPDLVAPDDQEPDDPEPETAELQINAIDFDPELLKINEPFDLTVRYEELTGEETGAVTLSLEIKETDIFEEVLLSSHTAAGNYLRTFSNLQIDEPGDYDVLINIDAPNADAVTFTETIEIIDPDTLPPELMIESIDIIDSYRLEPDELFSVEVSLAETVGIATENLTVQLSIDGTDINETQSLGVLEGDSQSVTFSDLAISSADAYQAVITLQADNIDDVVMADQRFTVSNHPHEAIEYPEGLELLWQEDPSFFPYSAIGQVVVNIDGGGFGLGTGFMISPQHFMTNAHVVDLGGSVNNITMDGVDVTDLAEIQSIGLLLGQNGSWQIPGSGDPFPDGQLFGERIWSLEGGSSSGLGANFSDDLAIVRLETPLDDDFQHFNWYWNDGDTRDLSGETLFWAGYPNDGFTQDSDPDPATPPEFYMWQAFGEIMEYDHSAGQLNLTPDIQGSGGASGSPLLMDIDGSLHFVGAYAGRVMFSDDRPDIGAGATLTPEAHDWALQIVQADGYLQDEFFVA